MDIALINKKTNICENVAVFESLEAASEMFSDLFYTVKLADGYGIGDMYKESVWSKIGVKLTNSEKREQAYECMLYKEDGSILLSWDNVAITVDTANKKWLDYSAEGSTIVNDLSALIVSAKEYIRELYPDE